MDDFPSVSIEQDTRRKRGKGDYTKHTQITGPMCFRLFAWCISFRQQPDADKKETLANPDVRQANGLAPIVDSRNCTRNLAGNKHDNGSHNRQNAESPDQSARKKGNGSLA
jgi:hypothetical protein